MAVYYYYYLKAFQFGNSFHWTVIGPRSCVEFLHNLFSCDLIKVFWLVIIIIFKVTFRSSGVVLACMEFYVN